MLWEILCLGLTLGIASLVYGISYWIGGQFNSEDVNAQNTAVRIMSIALMTGGSIAILLGLWIGIVDILYPARIVVLG